MSSHDDPPKKPPPIKLPPYNIEPPPSFFSEEEHRKFEKETFKEIEKHLDDQINRAEEPLTLDEEEKYLAHKPTVEDDRKEVEDYIVSYLAEHSDRILDDYEEN